MQSFLIEKHKIDLILLSAQLKTEFLFRKLVAQFSMLVTCFAVTIALAFAIICHYVVHVNIRLFSVITRNDN